MSFSELLKQCRKQQGMSQAELASKLGVTQQAVGKWESGKSSPDPTTVARIAEILSTTADFLLGLYRPVASSNTPEERFFGNYAESLIPVIGTVKAGYGALAFEEDYGQEYARVKDPSNYFYLVVRGDSMEPRIQDGDLALVHKQDTLENGDLGVLVYGDEGEGTLKRQPGLQRNGHQGRGPEPSAHRRPRGGNQGEVVKFLTPKIQKPFAEAAYGFLFYPFFREAPHGTVFDGQTHNPGRQRQIRCSLHFQRGIPRRAGRQHRQLLRAGLLPRLYGGWPLRQPFKGADDQLLLVRLQLLRQPQVQRSAPGDVLPPGACRADHGVLPPQLH